MNLEDDRIPEESVRPLKDLGHHLSFLSSVHDIWEKRESLALMKEDNWCFEPVIGLGMAEPPSFSLKDI
ncbi:MAG: hypothetical protein QXS76_02435, partial [Candidatus Bathyarchaeia archaeon]